MNILRQNKEKHPLIYIKKFLSDIEIDRIFQISKNIEYQESLVKNINKNSLSNFCFDKNARESKLKRIIWNKETDWMYNKIIRCINEVNLRNYGYILKFVEDFQFTEYPSEIKGFYGRHNDCGSEHEIDNFVDIRKLSFTIQLSHPSEYSGGELKFYTGKKTLTNQNDEFDVAKKDRGSIIFFPSNIVHEVTPVTEGRRYSLVSWVQGPNIL